MIINTGSLQKAAFTISLDLELYWGVTDSLSLNNYYQNIAGVHQAIPALLELFDQYNIHATWATVGFLHFNNVEQLKEQIPPLLPSYNNPQLSPYKYIADLGSESDDVLHFCPDLIELIQQYANQEIGTHTFCHYYCLESGQTKSEFQADLNAAIQVAMSKNIETKSLVFPRNQFNQDYLEILENLGIACYRGNPHNRIYNSEAGDANSIQKKLLRLLDAYVNISGQNCHSWSELGSKYPTNIPASSFLRPYSKKLESLDSLRLRRITTAMEYAARKNQVYHLWWHPHNFGVNLKENLNFLTQILECYKKLNDQNKMHSLNMREIGELCQNTSLSSTRLRQEQTQQNSKVAI